MTSGLATFRVDGPNSCSILIDGKVAVQMPYESLNSRAAINPVAQVFEPPGAAAPARKVALGAVPRDEKTASGAVLHMVDIEVLGGLLGASVDVDGARIDIMSPRYWAQQLGLTRGFGANPLHLVPQFGISPPAKVLMMWVRPPAESFVQIYKVTDGIPRAMLGLDSTGQPVNVEGGDFALARRSDSAAPVRAETQAFERTIGRFGRYVAVVSRKDPGTKDLLDSIEDQTIGLGDVAIVGLRQRFTASPVKFEAVKLEPGETLVKFADRTKTDLSLLQAINGLRDGEVLRPGQKLVTMADIVPFGPMDTYVNLGNVVTEGGDTLASLAKAWGVTEEQLLDANPALVPGTSLAAGDLVRKIGPKVASKPVPAVPSTIVGSGFAKGSVALKQSLVASSQTLATIPDGSTVSILNEVSGGAFYQVIVESKYVGYVKKSELEDVSITKEVAAPPAELPGATPAGKRIIIEATRYLGTPYNWGGNCLTTGIDCSHFVAAVFSRTAQPCPPPPVSIQEQTPIVHYKEPGGPALQGAKQITLPTAPKTFANLQPGDRIIIQRGLTGATGSRHTGIYAGRLKYGNKVFSNAVVHAARPGVRIDELTGRLLWNNYRFSVRGRQRVAQAPVYEVSTK
ncbi:MAG: LysM peptidoglycan-binding domain-containing protein [Fimbriimonas sp.]